MKTMNGNMAAAHVAYAFTEVAAIYPITPSSPIGEYVDEWAAFGRKNIFGQIVKVRELQSEGGASAAIHGALQAGSLASTFTSSQGLLLMIPNMYKISGELLPAVLHVSARTISTHALSIFGDHSDVMATRQTGFAILASGSIQEIMDLGGIAHLSAIKSRIPFLHFFDGFRSSHEIQKIKVINYEDIAKLVDYDAVTQFRKRALNSGNPVTKGTTQNPDIFFQQRESQNRFYNAVPDITENYMEKIYDLTGRKYHLFDYYGAPDAENIIVAMGSVVETIQETVDYLLNKGEKVGLIKVRLYRPFSPKHFFRVLPKTVKKIAVLDRTKEPGSLGEPLYQDIKTMFYIVENKPLIVGGRYGLSSKDTTPSHIKAVFDNLKNDNAKDNFTIGINDDVTHYSLNIKEEILSVPNGTIQCKFWGFGSDGTVGANENSIKIIGDNTDLYAQGYFEFDAKKSGGVTISHLRFGKHPIKSAYLVYDADFIACHNQSYINQYDLLKGLKDKGIFLLNCQWDIHELDKKLSAKMKKYLANHNIIFYTIDATSIAKKIGLGNRINIIMQAAFFKLINVIQIENVVKYMKEAVQKSYGLKGEDIVRMNMEAIDRGIDSLIKIEIPSEWSNSIETVSIIDKEEPDFIKNVLRVINKHEGDSIPVSIFLGAEDGTFPQGITAYEKRGVAVNAPEWLSENCIQCNQCSFVCPHAAIRPFLLTDKETKDAPNNFKTVEAKGKELEHLKYCIQVSILDCMGCENCINVCPAKNKALVMKPLSAQEEQIKNWEYAVKVPAKDYLVSEITVKGSQFKQPLLEFSGACAGCGETPYVKLITQLFGDRMIIANSNGCSTAWGGTAPFAPYTTNFEGRGPAWANSLFEDNAEYGYGIHLGNEQLRDRIEILLRELADMDIKPVLKQTISEWILKKDENHTSKILAAKIIEMLEKDFGDKKTNMLSNELLQLKNYLIKSSIWLLGGDGWAYDIGYGGLDHILASGENINTLVYDTELYSNTGGQASKATPMGAVAKFAASGKKVGKKNLGLLAITYGYIYVAQVAMGANKNQTLKAFIEAEQYNGPSLIIAYAPCINHGIKIGMGNTQLREKQAVDSGYWHLYRYNPELKKEGKNPFILDSPEPKESFTDFLLGEVRYSSLLKTFPDNAKILFKRAEFEAREKYLKFKKMAEEKY